MKLLYSLLFSLLLANSLFAVTYTVENQLRRDYTTGEKFLMIYANGYEVILTVDASTYYDDTGFNASSTAVTYNGYNIFDSIDSGLPVQPDGSYGDVRWVTGVNINKEIAVSCTSPQVLDVYTNTCVDTVPIADLDDDSDGILNKCDLDYIDFQTSDCSGNGVLNNVDTDIDGDGIVNALDGDADPDGDGLINSLDPDDDNDGIADNIDPDSGDYDPFKEDSSCGEISTDPLVKDGSILYSFNDYLYKGSMSTAECNNFLLDTNIDSILNQPDKNVECSVNYCFAHAVSKSCSFIPESYAPGSTWVYKNLSSSSCAAKVDFVLYSASQVKVPDPVNCPTTSFCFLKPAIVDTPERNQTAPSDLNSTSLDLAPLLKSQNDTNLNLEDIKDKLDNSNLSLEEISKNSNNLLSTNQDMKSSLDDFSLASGKYQSESLSQQKHLTNNTNAINDNVKITNSKLGTIASNTAVIAGNSAKTVDKVTEMVDAMFGDAGLNPDGTINDGSANFGDVELEVTNSFSGFVQTNFFTFATQTYTIPTISFSILNNTFTLISAEMMSSLDIASIRAMFLFFFALSGFITVVKTV